VGLVTEARQTVRREPASPFGGLEFAPGEDLVAVGGTLDADLVLDAYRHGVFPWYGEEDPVLWWSPDPRAVLDVRALHVPRRLAQTLRARDWELRIDGAFADVVRGCAEGRSDGTWIHEEMVACYVELFSRGRAHSIEVRERGRLVGGVYGVAVGGIFCAESMFHRVRDASKAALVSLVRHLAARGFSWLDVQFRTDHLERFGVVEIPRAAYLARLRELRDRAIPFR
jgi:leucyl/phenylalanyl-tRNA--protein transferase